MRGGAEHHGPIERGLEELGGGAEPIVQIQDLRLTDRQLQTLAILEGAGIDAAERFAGRTQVGGIRCLAKPLQLDASENDARRVRQTVNRERFASGARGRLVLTGVVEPARFRQRIGRLHRRHKDQQTQRGQDQARHHAMVTHERM